MGWFTKYPGTDYSQITLDHILLQLSELGKTVADLVARVIRLENQGGGGGGTTDYDDLSDKPKLNNKVIEGDRQDGYYHIQHEIDISTSYPGDVPVLNMDGDFEAKTLTAGDVGAIPAPLNPSANQYAMWNGSAWVASSLPLYDGS